MLLFLTASEQLPVGTAYAVFVGLGTVATVVTGWVAFGDGMTIAELVFLVILLGGIIGLKLWRRKRRNGMGIFSLSRLDGSVRCHHD